MIQVIAPEGWIDPTADEMPVSKSGSSEGDFDDIDQVLAQMPTEQPKRPPQRPAPKKSAAPAKSPARPTTSPSAEKQIQASRDSQDPLLPNDQWTAPETQQRRKWLVLTAASVGLILLTTAMVVAVASQLSTADNESGNETEQAPDIDKILDDQDADAEQVADGEPVNAADSENVAPDKATSETEDTNQDQDTVTDENTVASPTDGLTNNPPINGDDNTAETSETTQITDANAPASSPFGFDDLLEQSPDIVETNFGALSDALESQGTSLFEINQIANQNGSERRGISKYYVAKPPPVAVENLSRLAAPCGSIEWNDQSLLQALAELNQITGVPISFDSDVLSAAGFDFGYSIPDFTASATDFQSVIQTVLESIDATLDYDGQSFARVTLPNVDTLRTETLPLPILASTDAEVQKYVLKQIQLLIAPDSWDDPGQNVSLTIAGDQLVVTHDYQTVHLISQFVEKWNKALAIRQGQRGVETLASRWARTKPARNTPLSWSNEFAMPIPLYLARIQRETGVNIVVDWYAADTAGWNPQTMLPADIEEAVVEDLLGELAHAMDLTFRVVDENTFELTTRDAENTKPYLEVYSCTQITATRLQSDQLIDLMRQTLRTANPDDIATRAYYEKQLDAFFVVATQPVQRQFEAVLNRLRKP